MNVFYFDICICTYVYILYICMIIHVCTFVYIYTPFIHFYICQDGLQLQPLSFQSVFSSSKTSQSPHVARVGHETSLMHLCFEFWPQASSHTTTFPTRRSRFPALEGLSRFWDCPKIILISFLQVANDMSLQSYRAPNPVFHLPNTRVLCLPPIFFEKKKHWPLGQTTQAISNFISHWKPTHPPSPRLGCFGKTPLPRVFVRPRVPKDKLSLGGWWMRMLKLQLRGCQKSPEDERMSCENRTFPKGMSSSKHSFFKGYELIWICLLSGEHSSLKFETCPHTRSQWIIKVKTCAIQGNRLFNHI